MSSSPTHPAARPCLTSAPVAAAAVASFNDLPAALHQHIATYLTAQALLRVGRLSRKRGLYLSEIEARGCLRIGEAPLTADPPPKRREERMPWVIRHAAVVARLLRQMPRLQTLDMSSPKIGMDYVLGQALLLLPGPTQLAEFRYEHSNLMHHDRLLEREAPHPFAMALNQGKLSFLRTLDHKTFAWTFMNEKHNRDLVSAAIMMGYLPHLMDLGIDGYRCVEALESAFKSRWRMLQHYPQPISGSSSKGQGQGNAEEEEEVKMDEEEEKEEEVEGGGPPLPRQALVERLQISTFGEESWGPLTDFLKVPFFGHLRELLSTFEGDFKAAIRAAPVWFLAVTPCGHAGPPGRSLGSSASSSPWPYVLGRLRV